ncbi:MAG TPA: alpha/beta hydrolase [Anaeromyxobacteraceae bacterium]|nr:alpha/beta hydrolase [Anaeromyxobacteraceae bacterium]
MTADPLFPGFEVRRFRTSGAEIHGVVGGSGPPLLLLHGFPQTHAIWHRIAPRLAERFTVVATDLRGYGDSARPASDERHAPYSKRAMAQDQVEVMGALGFGRFALVGHDRGGRVAHRLARDHGERVERLAVLDISPTLRMYQATDQRFATLYYHWFFLIQPHDLPERLVGADPDYYLMKKLGGWGTRDLPFAEGALAEYRRCFRDPAAFHAMCEDYRASATIDLEHDAADAGRRLSCPLLVLWGANGVVHRCFRPLDDWREVAEDVRGEALPAGHYLPEEVPDATCDRLLRFLGGGR